MWYVLDTKDRLTKVSDDWDLHAMRCGGSDAVAANVLGRSIWSFIDGEKLAEFYARVFTSARKGPWKVQARMRDDGPGRETLLQLTVSLQDDDTVLVEAQTLRERAVRIHGLWNPVLTRSGDLIQCCSQCKKVKVNTRWLPIKDAEQYRADLCGVRPPQITHSICPACSDQLTQPHCAAKA